MIVVGLDPSLTNAGIAVLDAGHPIALRSIGRTSAGCTYAHRCDRIVHQTRTITHYIADTCLPNLAVIEGPAYGANLPSHFDRAGLFWGLYAALRAQKVPTAVITPATRALFATGKGRADKRTVLAAVRDWWPDRHIADHDIADALVLAAAGAFHYGDPMPFEVRDRHTANLAAVKWPALAERQP